MVKRFRWFKAPLHIFHGFIHQMQIAFSRRQIKTPPLPCGHSSFEHVLQHVEPAGLLSTSSEGVSATTLAKAPGSSNYGSRICRESRTGQGKTCKRAKDQLCLRCRSEIKIALRAGFFKEKMKNFASRGQNFRSPCAASFG
jgi:hypothetical protein